MLSISFPASLNKFIFPLQSFNSSLYWFSNNITNLDTFVRRNFEAGLLKYRNKNKEVWFNTKTNKGKLCTIPFGEDSIYIVASYFQSDDGVEALKHLEKLLDS